MKWRGDSSKRTGTTGFARAIRVADLKFHRGKFVEELRQNGNAGPDCIRAPVHACCIALRVTPIFHASDGSRPSMLRGNG
jgi:hypothetical protein